MARWAGVQYRANAGAWYPDGPMRRLSRFWRTKRTYTLPGALVAAMDEARRAHRTNWTLVIKQAIRVELARLGLRVPEDDEDPPAV